MTELNAAEENTHEAKLTSPVLFLLVWLGLPMISMVGYAAYLLHAQK